MKAIRVVILLASIAAAALALHWWVTHRRGVEIRVHDVDEAPLRAVTVVVGGQSYAVGDLARRETRSVWADPDSASAVEVSFTTAAGETKHLPVPNSDVPPGATGWISIDLTATEARNVDHDVEAN